MALRDEANLLAELQVPDRDYWLVPVRAFGSPPDQVDQIMRVEKGANDPYVEEINATNELKMILRLLTLQRPEVMTEDFSAELAERCAKAISPVICGYDCRSAETARLVAVDVARIVLRESGHAELVMALQPFVSDHPITIFDYWGYREEAKAALKKAGAL